jgi:hypothetical protein
MCATAEIWEACWHVSRPELHARSRDVSRVTEVWICAIEFNAKSHLTSQLYALTSHELTWREDSVSPALGHVSRNVCDSGEACWHVSRPELHARSRDASRVTEVWICAIEFKVKSPFTSQLHALTSHELTWRDDSVFPAFTALCCNKQTDWWYINRSDLTHARYFSLWLKYGR